MEAGIGALFEHIQRGELDPSYLLTHRVTLDDASKAYKTFGKREDNCMRVVIAPWRTTAHASACSPVPGASTIQ
jgi:threonine dehydrogenase-like Zn-dependent dehydrogenase